MGFAAATRAVVLGALACCGSMAGQDAPGKPSSAPLAALVEWALNASPGPAPAAALAAVTAVHDDPLRAPAARKSVHGKTEVWVRPLSAGRWAVGLFNRGESKAQVDVVWKEIGLPGTPQVRGLIPEDDPGKVHGGFARALPPHGAVLYVVYQ
jgi:hypothetical protein